MSKKKDFSTITIKLRPGQQEAFEALVSKLKSEHGFNEPVSQIALSLIGFPGWSIEKNLIIEDARNSLRSSIINKTFGNFKGKRDEMLHTASEVQRIFDELSPEMKAFALNILKRLVKLNDSWNPKRNKKRDECSEKN